MTTEKIRKRFRVDSWGINTSGILITYSQHFKEKGFWSTYYLELGKEEVCQELNALGEINYYGPNEIEWDNERLDWVSFTEEWTFSQWDALHLVVRHEYRKLLEQDTNMQMLDKSLQALKNGLDRTV